MILFVKETGHGPSFQFHDGCMFFPSWEGFSGSSGRALMDLLVKQAYPQSGKLSYKKGLCLEMALYIRAKMMLEDPQRLNSWTGGPTKCTCQWSFLAPRF